MYIILTWHTLESILLVMNEYGTAKLFKSHLEAEKFAESELNFNWQIVQVAP